MPVFRTGPLPASAITSGLRGGTLSVDVDANATVSGTATPGAVIEVQNLSVAPTTGELVGDGKGVVVVGADGAFRAAVTGAVAGDVLQVQVRDGDGTVNAAVQVRVDAARARFDPRAAFVHLGRLRVDADASRGVLTITSRTRMPVCEPDAVIRFQNARTGAFTDVVVDPRGLVGVVELGGVAGDDVVVSVSDGSANVDFAVSCGTLTSTKPAKSDPAPQLADRWLGSYRLRGPLIGDNGPGYGAQGRIGNCPVPAACSALAAVDPDAVRDLIRPRGDGTFVVTFHPVNQPPVEVVVDDSVFTAGSGPHYGRGALLGNGDVETWFPLVEKAYAAWVGGYEVLGQGTSVGKVLSEITGRPVSEVWLNATVDKEALWQRCLRARAQGQAIAVGTADGDPTGRTRAAGLYPDHAYSVVGVSEQNGVRHLVLRNPWGSGAGVSSGVVGNARVDGGVFSMKLDDVVQLFEVLNIA